MTLDEAIKHAREKAKEQKYYAVFERGSNFSSCIKCAEEHEQLAEWLEELKEYRIAFDLLLKDDCLNDKDWLGRLDELYFARKDYYFDKAKEIIKDGETNEIIRRNKTRIKRCER